MTACTSFLVFSLSLCGLTAARAAQIIARGKPCLPIAVADTATPGELDAAAELAKHLGKSCASHLEVKRESELTGKAGIFVGRTRVAAKAGLPRKELPDEAYEMQIEQDKALLCGGSDMSTKFAVYG